MQGVFGTKNAKILKGTICSGVSHSEFRQ